MGQYNESGIKAFTNGGTAIGKHLRVKLSSGVLALAGVGASDETIGITLAAAAANEANVPVALLSKQGTLTMIASAATIAEGALVYGAAVGKVSSTSSGTALGRALHAVGAAGGEVEVRPGIA